MRIWVVCSGGYGHYEVLKAFRYKDEAENWVQMCDAEGMSNLQIHEVGLR